MKSFFQEIIIYISNFLTGTRPQSYVRKMQMYLLAFTLMGTTVILSYPSFQGTEFHFKGDENWEAGKNAPSAVIATENMELPRMREYKLAVEDAQSQAPLHFDRNFAVLDRINQDSQHPEVEQNQQPGAEQSDEPKKDKTARMLIQQDLSELAQCKNENIGFAAVRSCIRKNIPRWRRLNNDQLNSILVQSPHRLEDLVRRTVNIIFQRYVILSSETSISDEFSGSTVKVHDLNAGPEVTVKTLPEENVIHNTRLFSSEVQERFENLLSDRMPGVNAMVRSALVDLAGRYLYGLGGADYNAEETREEQRQAVLAVQVPIKRINRGEVIIAKDEVITDEKREALEYHNRARWMGKIQRLASIIIQQVLLVGIILYFSFRFGFKRLSDVSSNLIVFITIWMFAITLFLLKSIWGENPEYNEVTYFFGSWIPVGLFVVLLSIIFGEVLTIPVGIYLSFLIFVASKYDPHSFLIAISMALTGSILGSRIQKRLHFITTSFLITGVGFVTVTASYLYTGRPIMGTLMEKSFLSGNYVDAMIVVFFSGISTVFVIAILPMFETVFNVPTRFKLQELSDPSNPVLQELFRQAPSTWTHTLMVAAMSEKAGEKLGLNTILIRTGVYYHDIGKMSNPGFFIENKHLVAHSNQSETSNPQNAARIIINHVKEGMEMARAARLPREVIAFIPEHHGDSTMSFFYHRALEKGRRRVNREEFRYPGPRPRSKETAIVMLADSVEAASRSLEYVDDETVNALIKKIINTKVTENQLDDSGLTLGDLAVIRESFREIILSSYHNRPRYPDQDDTTKLEDSRKKTPSKKAPSKKTGGKKANGKKGSSESGKSSGR